ncbi:Nodulation protein S (NodS) [Oryzisolibacter propanilivorax]|uniref:Nodulation protein S (NodS) n=1 Tax=Oryzisolibacter propanilivorax TaxID=1527607 RepID=A0A1G9S193_9BURK|nr:SAM-dependent methyltransferase [Oryzisolibacter propanilivorax]SDM29037.1 Nodulation protein S (NodS) [Oryzisolibacter propanilivorax]
MQQHAWDPARFDALYGRSDDPWALEGSWYEQRKRALLLASLPQRHYASAFEPGCAQGLLTEQLAQRCDLLLAGDCAPRALASAARRLQGRTGVRLEHIALPQDWPEQGFDLVVLSELLYYLSPVQLDLVVARLLATPGAALTLVACHWCPRIEGCALSGAEVHARLRTALPWPLACSVDDADFALDVWVRGGNASLAQEEGRI